MLGLLVRCERGLALAVGLAAAGSSVVTAAVKQMVGRPRPVVDDRLVDAGGHAFPSGRASQAVVLYGVLTFVVWMRSSTRALRWGALVMWMVLAFLVGISRVYLGVHWASDVVAGWFVGFGWLVAVCALAWSGERLGVPRRWWSATDGAQYSPGGSSG